MKNLSFVKPTTINTAPPPLFHTHETFHVSSKKEKKSLQYVRVSGVWLFENTDIKEGVANALYGFILRGKRLEA